MSKLLINTHPYLMEEYDYENNPDINLSKLTYGSPKIINWICRKKENICGCIHRWSESANSRTNSKTNCPYCSNAPKRVDYHDSLAYLRPDLLEEWDYENNKIKPEEVTLYSAKKVNWICKNNINTCGCIHYYPAIICNRTDKKSRCPYCHNGTNKIDYHESIAYLRPDLLNEWNYEKNTIKPEEIGIGSSDKKVWWKCLIDNNHDSYLKSPYERIGRNSSCSRHQHKTEEILFDFLISEYPNLNIKRQIRFDWCINPETNQYLPFDYLVEGYNLLIELDGKQHFEQVAKWESPEIIRKRDIYKIQQTIQNGYSIIHIYQKDVWKNVNNWKEKIREKIQKYENPQFIFISSGNEYMNHINDLNIEVEYDIPEEEYKVLTAKLSKITRNITSVDSNMKKVISSLNKLSNLT